MRENLENTICFLLLPLVLFIREV